MSWELGPLQAREGQEPGPDSIPMGPLACVFAYRQPLLPSGS